MTAQAEIPEERPISLVRVTEVDEVDVIQISQMEETQHSEISYVTVPGSKGTSPTIAQNGPICHICQNRRFYEPDAAPYDKRLLNACACSSQMHHGCMADLIKTVEKCIVCGTNYRFYKYGSRLDFFKKYWCRLTVITGICLLAVTLGISGIIFSFPLNTAGSLAVFVMSCTALVIGYNVVSQYLTWMYKTEYSRFKKKYRTIAVFNYNPEISNYRKNKAIRHIDDVDANLINLDSTTNQDRRSQNTTLTTTMASTPVHPSNRPEFPDGLIRFFLAKCPAECLTPSGEIDTGGPVGERLTRAKRTSGSSGMFDFLPDNGKEIWENLLSDILSEGNENRKLRVLLQATLLGCTLLAVLAIIGIIAIYTKQSYAARRIRYPRVP